MHSESDISDFMTAN